MNKFKKAFTIWNKAKSCTNCDGTFMVGKTGGKSVCPECKDLVKQYCEEVDRAANPVSTLYYIESRNHGPVGNAILWWRHNSAGYTTNLTDAAMYDKHDAELICRDEGNVKHLTSTVEKAAHLSVDPCDLYQEKNSICVK